MYTLTPELAEFLLSPEAGAALRELAVQGAQSEAELAQIAALRKHFSPAEAAALLEQARLRQKAAAKFPDADRLFFIDEALQQASSRAVAAYRAQSFAGYRRVADLGCGIGADTLALAEAGPEVLAVELDPVRARLAEANVAARGLSGRVRVICGDWTTLALDADAAFVDPARRAGERRVFSLHAAAPPLSAILALRARIPDVALKAAPGVAHAEIPAAAEVEFISERGELKEALLRFGALRTGAAQTATLLPGPHRLDNRAANAALAPRAPGAYLYEPDPAIIRAGLVQHLGTQLAAAQLDAEIAYLTGDALRATPFARVWEVLEHAPFNLKELNRRLRALAPGEVIVKKRGSPIDPDAFRRRLNTVPGGPVLTVFLTHVLGKPWMVVGRERANV